MIEWIQEKFEQSAILVYMDANMEYTNKNQKKYFNKLKNMRFEHLNNTKYTRKGYSN